MPKPGKQSRAEYIATLEQKLFEAQAYQVHHHHFASSALPKAHVPGSAIILELTFLGGRKLCDPIAIRDGLSEETIKCIQADIQRSFEDAIAFKPKKVTP